MKSILSLAAFAAIVIAPVANAEISDAEYQELKAQLAAISARLDQVAAENAELRAAQEKSESAISDVQTSIATIPASGSDWTDRVRMDGDFRFRYEEIDPEGGSDRERTRIRARVNVKGQVTDRIEAGVGIATGGNDPVSTNQTLGAGGSSKNVALNLAYVDIAATDRMNVVLGKFKNPLTRVGGQPLLWDGDWTSEGFAVKYKNGNFFATGMGSWLESDSRGDNSVFAWGGQFGMSGTVGDVKLKGGIGYFVIPTQGRETVFGDPSDPGDYYGNTAIEVGSGLPCGSTGAGCVYAYDYNLTELFGEAAFDIGDWPAIVFIDYVQNGDASANDTGWMLGTKIGAAKDRGQMQFTYYYAEKEADAIYGLLTDSDFGGGGTDSKGHWIKMDFGVTKNWAIGAQFFFNQVDLASGSKSDYNRFMIDSQWKWK